MTEEIEEIPKKNIALPQTVTVKRFADLLGLPVTQVIMELMKNKIIATINEEIDYETASVIAMDLGVDTHPAEEENVGEMTLEKLIELCEEEKKTDKVLTKRAPIVTILGHVDHGKTTLLDTIRKANVAEGEAGGITQRITAYQVKKRGELITFIDTPGHEAFSGMRERGVSIADIAILVVAADDGVRPQTKEVITYLLDKKIPTIVAINKIDKPDANLARVKQELADQNILIEEWGGTILCNEISAKQNIGIDKLLESILLIHDVEEFRADAKRDGFAVILESHLDPQKGPIATGLVKTGTLKVGQDVIAGGNFGRIKRIEDFNGKMLEQAGPSTPVVLYGFDAAPQVNSVVQVVSSKSLARLRSQEALLKEGENKSVRSISENSDILKFPIILKADVQGSLEAIEQILSSIQSEEIVLQGIRSAVGAITESDVKMANSSHAMILGFNAEPTSVASRLAETMKVEIETFNIIYKLVERVKEKMVDLLPPEIIRVEGGNLSVLAIFKTGKRDMIVGGRVAEGKLFRGSLIEVKRDGEIVGLGKMMNLQQNKLNADEVNQGNECGIVYEGNIKVEVGDTLVCYKEETRKRKL